MKTMQSTGMTYYIIPSGYNGDNKEPFTTFVSLPTLYQNDIVIMYDWGNGLALYEDRETLDGSDVFMLPAKMLITILTDDDVIEWMYRERDGLYDE